MVLDMLKFDTYLNRLVLIGIEGVHYTINDQGEYTLTDKGRADYAPMVVSASWAIKNGNLTEAGAPAREKALSDAWQARVMSNPTITFVFDDSNVAAYVSSVQSVLQEYVPMIELGLVDDVDAAMDEMIKRCYDSGLQKVYDEFYAQYEAWYVTR